MRRLCLLAAVLCLISVSVMAEGGPRSSKDYLSFLPPPALDKLVASGEVTNIAASIHDLPLWQNSPLGERIRAAVKDFDSTVAAEGFFLIDLPAPPGAELDQKIFKSFTSFSSLKGLQVYSVSKGAMETFLFDASLVDPADRSRRLPDVDAPPVPAQSDYTVYEKEEQTGDSYARFHLDFSAEEDTFAVSVTNLTAMNYLFFTLVEPGNLRTFFFVVPCQDRIVLYGLTAVKTGHFLGLERVKEKSFYYRMRALVSWFASNMKQSGT